MLVIDASVAIKWFVAEPLHAEACELLAGAAPLIAPDLLLLEAANVVWKKQRRGELTSSEGRLILAALSGGLPVLHPSVALIDAAVSLAVRLEHPVYDCVYLALAVKEGAPLITADHQVAKCVADADLAAQVVTLGAASAAQ